VGGALLAKPHLAMGLAVWLLAQRDRRALAGAAAGVAAASLAFAGPVASVAWLGSLRTAVTHSPLASMLGVIGLAGSWIHQATAAQTLAAIASVLAVAACGLLGDRARRHPALLEPSLAGATALSLVAAPHLLPRDLVLLAPALAWTVGWATREGGRRLAVAAVGWLALNLAALLDLGSAGSPPRAGWCRWCSSPRGWSPPASAAWRCAAGVGRRRFPPSPAAEDPGQTAPGVRPAARIAARRMPS
jgi:hypothetical protein